MTTLATTRRFLAVPLTPVHIGDGTELTPECFRIEGDMLERFDAAAVLAGMDGAQRKRFLGHLDAGRLKDAQAELHKAVRQGHVVERIRVGPASQGDLKTAVENPNRSGRASPFIRTGGRPFVPGSSLKGAFRTALLNDFAHDADHRDRCQADIGSKIEGLKPFQKATNRVSDELQALAFDCAKGATERDPLRWLSVGDGMLLAAQAATRIDRVSVGWKDGKAPKMQLHAERLSSFADDEMAAAFRFDITVTPECRQETARRMDRNKAPQADLSFNRLMEAAHTFHHDRWQAELDRHFKAYADKLQRLRDGLERELQRLAGAAPVLLRVGRFGHFESKSVDEWRRGWQAMPRPGRHVENGATRAVIQGIRDFPLPFGWVLLCPETPELLNWAKQHAPTATEAPRADPGGSAVAEPPAKASPTRRPFLDGQEIEIVSRAPGQVCFRFVGTTDTEWIDEEEIEYR